MQTNAASGFDSHERPAERDHFLAASCIEGEDLLTDLARRSGIAAPELHIRKRQQQRRVVAGRLRDRDSRGRPRHHRRSVRHSRARRGPRRRRD